MIGMYARHTGRAAEQLARDLDRDRFLSAQEAVDHGLIDRIVHHRPDQRS
jgi:ATP-dependent Clp protease protease subunit